MVTSLLLFFSVGRGGGGELILFWFMFLLSDLFASQAFYELVNVHTFVCNVTSYATCLEETFRTRAVHVCFIMMMPLC